jgi:hypothetical protein
MVPVKHLRKRPSEAIRSTLQASSGKASRWTGRPRGFKIPQRRPTSRSPRSPAIPPFSAAIYEPRIRPPGRSALRSCRQAEMRNNRPMLAPMRGTEQPDASRLARRVSPDPARRIRSPTRPLPLDYSPRIRSSKSDRHRPAGRPTNRRHWPSLGVPSPFTDRHGAARSPVRSVKGFFKTSLQLRN